MHSRSTKRADSIDEMVMRQLIREYMIQYKAPSVTGATPAKEKQGVLGAALNYIKTILGVSAVIFLMNNKDALVSFATKFYDTITSIPETMEKITTLVGQVSSAVTTGGIGSLLSLESKQASSIGNQNLFEVDKAPSASAGPSGTVFKTAYGNLLATTNVLSAAKKNIEKFKNSRKPILPLDIPTIDANIGTDNFERSLQEAEEKIVKMIDTINTISQNNQNYPDNFNAGGLQWVAALAERDVKVPADDKKQREITNRALSDSLIVAIYNSLKDDVLNFIGENYLGIEKIQDDDVKSKFLDILKRFTLKIVKDVFENNLSDNAKGIVLPE